MTRQRNSMPDPVQEIPGAQGLTTVQLGLFTADQAEKILKRTLPETRQKQRQQDTIKAFLIQMLEDSSWSQRLFIPKLILEKVQLLIIQKELPPFYFKDAAKEMGLPTQSRKRWSPEYWARDSWHLRMKQNPRRLLALCQILYKVHSRVCVYPEHETYPEGMTRLKKRIEELKSSQEGKFKDNKIAQHLRMSYRSLTELAVQDSNFLPKHCPWEIIEKLDGAEKDIDLTVHSRTSQDKNGAQPVQRKPKQPKLPPDTGLEFIKTGQECRKCGAPWTHLYHNGQDAWGNTVLTCRLCGKDNPLQPEEDEEWQYIERYAPCWHCGGPFHNMARDGVDRQGNTIYTCILCSRKNCVAPRQKTRTA